MNKKINLEGTTFKFLYEKYKFYLLPIIITLTSIFLFLRITLPFLGEYQSLQGLKVEEEKKLQTLRSNYEILSNIDDGNLDSQLAVATDALPSGKDFASVLNAVSTSAGKSGVILGDYEFQVGNISEDTPSVKFPSLELVLTVNGGVSQSLAFVEELYKSVPLAEVLNMEINNNRSLITVIFYYKSLPGTPSVTAPIANLSEKNLSTINTIFTWNNARLESEFVPLVSTASATSPF